jgi:hypothetical protein
METVPGTGNNPHDAPGPEPSRRLITLRSEYRAAAGELLPLAVREVRIFDPDLADLGLHQEERTAQLRAFLKASRNNRLYIVLHNMDFLTRRAPRLMALLGVFSGSMFVNVSQGDATRVEDCFLLCDELHLVRRPVSAQPRGVVYVNDPSQGRGMRERFDQIWESSAPGAAATQIGL